MEPWIPIQIPAVDASSPPQSPLQPPFTIVPRHVLGGPRFVAPSDKVNVALIGAGGQGRHNSRALFQEDDCQIIALADPAEEWDLSQWYYGGIVGPRPGARGDREALRGEDAELQVRGVRGLPRHAGEGEVHRRRPHRHPRPPARLRVDPRDEGRQARLLREAAHPQHQRGTPGGPHGQGDGRRHADGQPGPLGRRAPADRRVAHRRRHRRRARGPRLERRAEVVQETLCPAGPAREACRASTGTSGSVPAPNGPTTAPTPRAAGATSGTSATAPCPTWASTTSIPRSTRWASTLRSPWRDERRRWIPKRSWRAISSPTAMAPREPGAPSPSTGTTTASGRPLPWASMPTTRSSGSGKATTAC